MNSIDELIGELKSIQSCGGISAHRFARLLENAMLDIKEHLQPGSRPSGDSHLMDKIKPEDTDEGYF